MASGLEARVRDPLKREPIEQRIRKAMRGRIQMPYHQLMQAVFPENAYPRAYNYATGGGPPGCAMAFNAALRRMRGGWFGRGANRTAWVGR